MEVPHSTFTLAKPDRRGRTFPQAIAHRGYKAANPENTMGAFRGAVEIGAHAIETDLHITKDGVLVISHDPSLKRCFGKDAKIIDCDWSYISTLRTVQAPHEPMPRLTDLLEYLTKPGLEDIWILLDIKLDNDADQLMSLIASSIREVKPTRPWNQRVLLGCWAAKYIPLCAKYLPDFPITHIGFSIGYAREFLSIPNILFGPGGSKFMADAKAAKRSMFAWTVNEEQWMRWCIKNNIDGVISDDPKKYLEVCEKYDSTDSKEPGFGLKDWALIIWFNLLAVLFSWLFRYRYGFKIDKKKVKEGYETSKRNAALSSEEIEEICQMMMCNHKQNYTYRCPLYLSVPRQKCVKTPPTIAHYFVSCRKCRGQNSDNFVVHWVERKNESTSSTVGGKEGNWRKGEENNYMLAIGTFEIVANGDETGRVKGARVYENGTEEARREKKGLKNVSLALSGTNKASFDAGPSHDIYDQTNESTQEIKLDGLRTQSLPIKGKSKKPNVFGSLRKMIVRPKSEQDTAATGEHVSPTQGNVKSKLGRFNTITGGFRGGKQSEDMEESSLSASAADRRVDDATRYEYLTPKEFLDLHFQGVVACSGADVAISNAISAPIDIPQKRQGDVSQKWTAERHAGEYMSEIGQNPFADNSEVVNSFIRDSTISDVENSHQEGTSERWSHDTHSSGQGRMSRETEFSQADEERMEIITEAIDGDTINLTPDNIDNVLAVWKGGFGTSTPSSPIHIPLRPHALSHSVHSRSIEALPIPIPFRSQGSGLDTVGHSASLPNTHGDEKRIGKSPWTQENNFEKVSSAPFGTSQHAVDFVEPPRCFDIPQKKNTTKEHLREFALPTRSNTGDAPHARYPPDILEEFPPQFFALPKRSNTGDVPYCRQLLDKTNELPHGFSFPERNNTENVPHSRHPLANEIARSNTLDSIPQDPARDQPLLPDTQAPAQETIAGTRYSSLPSSPTVISPPRKGKQSEQGHQSPRLWNRKGTAISKPESRTDPLVPERKIDRLSTVTTISQFIPSRNDGIHEEITRNVVSPSKTFIKAPRRRMGSSNVQRPIQHHTMSIPDVPAIPKTYAKHVAVLPKIGRDASGRFSIEHIKEGEPASMGKEEPGEVSREEIVEDSIDINANHTIGTWDAVLRNGPGDVSPLSSCEDLNRIVSPVSPVEGSLGGKTWDGEGRDGCLSGEMCEEGPGLLSQLIHPSTISPAHHVSTCFPSKHPPLSTFTPPQSLQSLHPSPSPSSLRPPQQHLHSHFQSPLSLQRIPQSNLSNTMSPIYPLDIDPSIDPSIPLIRPLRIRKKIPPPASRKTETENQQEIEARRRQRERMEEEFRRADERLRGLRDGKGGL
ncbi:putative glycerophosphoryl diester phosphodiesterase protein [Botrytis fragariae]|uniref:Putative glycerophosphoryl diester phosphodiesterase protein n=1 Tax=Botrytis fragariae TaxID=1964551 RepID=A0A8H6AX96_9HELO|nr:putative glycerophosphoryl diester phosphodiesterase protein [Botrytis fragariae]KAF5875180.1 putative glycerophosphoryl diester phosphodiesterase protein [Botrytis fragariae]